MRLGPVNTRVSSRISQMMATMIKLAVIILTALILIMVNLYYLHFLEPGNNIQNLLFSVITTTAFLLLGSTALAIFKQNHNMTARVIVSFVSALLAATSMILGIQFMFTYAHVHYSLIVNESLFTLIDTSLRTVQVNVLFGGGIVFIVIFIAFFCLSKYQVTKKLSVPQNIRTLLNILLFLVLLSTVVKTTELSSFFANRYGDNPMIDQYEKLYYQQIQDKIQHDYEIESQAESNIFVIQLESLNSEIVNENVTPSFYELSSRGVLVKNLQASSANTARVLETILCDVAPSINETLTKNPEHYKKLKCLPELLKAQGYKTLYIKHHDSDDEQYKEFIREIGFDEIINSELFETGDQELTWGPEDNIAYQRFFQYLEKKRDEKIFVYISLGSINHYPFKDHQNVEMTPTVDLTKERIEKKDQILTTNLQDIALGQAYNKYFKPMFSSNSHLFVYGDHAWPVGLHPFNKYNWAGGYQENFVTSLLFLPAADSQHMFETGHVSDNYYGSRDIFKAIMKLAGYKINKSHLYDEFSKEKQRANTGHCLMSIQPFTDKKIVITKFPQKYIIDVYGVTVERFDLIEDPDETEVLPVDKKFSDDPSVLFEECF